MSLFVTLIFKRSNPFLTEWSLLQIIHIIVSSARRRVKAFKPSLRCEFDFFRKSLSAPWRIKKTGESLKSSGRKKRSDWRKLRARTVAKSAFERPHFLRLIVWTLPWIWEHPERQLMYSGVFSRSPFSRRWTNKSLTYSRVCVCVF